MGKLWEKIIQLLIFLLILLLIRVNWCRSDEIGTASWYSRSSCLKESGQCIMANGRELKDEEFTCATWGITFGTKLAFTNVKNNRSVVAVVTDRGPAKRLVKKGRKWDLSKGAFSQIASLEQGVVEVQVRRIK